MVIEYHLLQNLISINAFFHNFIKTQGFSFKAIYFFTDPLGIRSNQTVLITNERKKKKNST